MKYGRATKYNKKTPRRNNVGTLLSDGEYLELKSVCEARGCKISHYIRSRVLNSVSRDINNGIDAMCFD